MLRELEPVVLTRDLPEHGLKRGDLGTIVHADSADRGYEVEFVTAKGKTVAVLTLGTDDVRAMVGTEILHARDFADTAP